MPHVVICMSYKAHMYWLFDEVDDEDGDLQELIMMESCFESIAT